MNQPRRNTTSNVLQHVTPWIEDLILSYGTETRCTAGDGGFLMAHVVNVGQMPLSQSQCSPGVTGLVFLSDGVLQIPAVLTSSTLASLQEGCDQESISSLINATVGLCEYKLRFHMSAVKRQCRFYLSVADLWMLASCQVIGAVSCNVFPGSVRAKIDQTWRKLQTQQLTAEEELENQELSVLLTEWNRDTAALALEDVRKKLVENRCRLWSRPLTSSKTPHPASNAADWERDRSRFKNHKLFSVPVKCLLMPEEGAPLVQTSSDRGTDGRTDRAEGLPGGKQASRGGLKGGTPASHPAGGPVRPENPEGWTKEVTWPVADSCLPVHSNPWDMFPSPNSISSCSGSSLGDQTLLDASKPRIRLCPYRPSQASSGRTSVTERQGPQPGLTAGHLTPASREPLTSAAATAAADQEVAPEQRATKRKKSDAEEPPTWDLEKPSCSSTQKESKEKRKSGSMRDAPRGQVHSCGAPFSYTYKTTAQNIQDFKNFKVERSVLTWAIRYLLDKGERSTNDHSCD